MKNTVGLITLLSVLFSTGCGFAPKGKGPLFAIRPPPPEKATVCHYRIKRTVGNGAYYILYTNDAYVATIGNGGYFEQELSPGAYEYETLVQVKAIPLLFSVIISGTEKIKPQGTFRVEPNSTYYLRWNVTESYQVEEVDKASALKELKGLKQFEVAEPMPDVQPLASREAASPLLNKAIREDLPVAETQVSKRQNSTQKGLVPNTLILPGGACIWDLNGEWDGRVEYYGYASVYGSYKAKIKIIQKNDDLEIWRISDSSYYRKGTLGMKGKVDVDGHITAEAYTFAGTRPVWGQVEDGGNRITFDDRIAGKSAYERER